MESKKENTIFKDIIIPILIPIIIKLIIFAIIIIFIWYIYKIIKKKAGNLLNPLKGVGETIAKPFKLLGKSKLPICKKRYYKSAGLCYKHCKRGYRKKGLICYQKCPRGFRNDGLYCAKPKPYGRGKGFPWKFGDKVFSLKDAKKRCKKKNKQGCQKSGAIYYPKCRKGFKSFGCCICSPKCKKGMKDIGVSCKKKTHGGGVGKIPKYCRKGYYFKAGLCYPKKI